MSDTENNNANIPEVKTFNLTEQQRRTLKSRIQTMKNAKKAIDILKGLDPSFEQLLPKVNEVQETAERFLRLGEK